MTTTTTTKRDVYAEITDTVLAALESGTAPWHKPWSADGGLPRSLSTRKPYRGINPFILELTAMSSGYASPFWGTYRKISELGGQIRKGEKSTTVVFWKKIMVADKENEGHKKPLFLLKTFNVFNAEQADWPEGSKLPVLTVRQPNDEERIAAAELVADGYRERGGPNYCHGGSRAFYIPSLDSINLPCYEDFDGADEYYSTLFHEFLHSTGHPSRLARFKDAGTFGSHEYGEEELVAEMGSAMLTGVTGITTTAENSAAYLRSWIKTISGNVKMVVQAAGKAQKACDHILGVSYADDNSEEM